ncbi:MAG: sulfotransferase [Pseudomonadota bacterium]
MNADELAAQARALVEQSNFQGAEQLLKQGLGNQPLSIEHSETLYVLAVAQRYQQKFEDALTSLTQLIELNPQHARAFQERGHLFLTLKRNENAFHSFRQAVELNAALPGSWRILVQMYQGLNDQVQVDIARDNLQYLESLPPELLGVHSFLNEGKLYRADQLCRHFLRSNKRHLEGMRLLAEIGNRLDVLDDAEFLLETCLELESKFVRARYDYANLLLKMQKFEKAYQQTELLVDEAPNNLSFLSLKANAVAGIGRHEEAIELYNRILEYSSYQPKVAVMRGHAEKTVGRLNDAIESYRQAYGLQADYGDAFWSLANTKSYKFSAEEIEQMRAQEARSGIDTEDQVHLCFALGKALEDSQQYTDSFEYYERGNALQLASLTAKPLPPEQRANAQIDVCTSAFFEARQDVGFDASDPIFILGLPRAGSTLLEQILASHSQIDGTQELPNIIALAQRLRNDGMPKDADNEPAYPRILETLDHDYFRRFGEQFIQDTQIYREDAPYFIDKNPNNFFHIGLIKLILPNAKIIDARRHPLSGCFSCFKQLFGQGQEFSYGLMEIGTYYREYIRLMDHWDDVLPSFVLRVQHEDVLDDLESQVRRMLDFLELPFEQSCLEYYTNTRSVRTPSSEQVRRPIFKTAINDWEPYESWLGPLKEALGEDVRTRFNIQ